MESPRIVQKCVASTVSDQSAPVVYNRNVDFPDATQYTVPNAQKINSIAHGWAHRAHPMSCIAHGSHSVRGHWDFPGKDSLPFPKLYRG